MIILIAMFATMISCGRADTGHSGIRSDNFHAASMACWCPDDDEDVGEDDSGKVYEDSCTAAEKAGEK